MDTTSLLYNILVEERGKAFAGKVIKRLELEGAVTVLKRQLNEEQKRAKDHLERRELGTKNKDKADKADKKQKADLAKNPAAPMFDK